MIDMIKKRRLWYALSLVVIVCGLVGIINRYRQTGDAMNWGVDFTGGTAMTLRFERPLTVEPVRDALIAMGLTKHTIQFSEERDVLIKTTIMDVPLRNQLFEYIRSNLGNFDVMEVDVIGPSMGDELQRSSWIIIIAVSIAILAYCSWRFEWMYGVSAVVALLHDALIVVAVSAVLGVEVNAAFVAALLTVLGYSINDTMIIFDRIREKRDANEGILNKVVINQAIGEMFARSIHTSVTTGLVVTALLIWGGHSLSVFAVVLLVGLITGTYSSIAIASPILYELAVSKKGVYE